MPKKLFQSLVDSRNQHTIKRDFFSVAAFVAIIWAVFFLDRFLPLEQYGLVPRDIHGLVGIVAMPFLHGDLAHIVSNTVPLAVTLFLLAGSRSNSGAIVLLITIIGGIALWTFGREARHIGASGLVFGLIAFHIFAGVFEKRIKTIFIALLVGGLYAGTLVKGVMPMQEGVSWDGHLFGALAGALVALITAKIMSDNDKQDRTKASRDNPFGKSY